MPLAAKHIYHSTIIMLVSFSRRLKAAHQRMPSKDVEHAGVQALAAKPIHYSSKNTLVSFSRRLKVEHQRMPSKDVEHAGVQALAAKHEKDSAKIILNTFSWRLKAVHQRSQDQRRKKSSQPNQASTATTCIPSLRCHVNSTMTTPLTKKSLTTDIVATSAMR